MPNTLKATTAAQRHTAPIDAPKPTLDTGLQRDQIQPHQPERRHKLHQPGNITGANPTPSTEASSTTESDELENPLFIHFFPVSFFSFSFLLSFSLTNHTVYSPQHISTFTLAFTGAVKFSSLIFFFKIKIILKFFLFINHTAYPQHVSTITLAFCVAVEFSLFKKKKIFF